MQQMKNNVFWYYLFQTFREPAFWGPVVMLYLHTVSGLSYGSLLMMEGITVVLIMLLQIPTGAFADLVGRRKSILIGMAIDIVSVVGFITASNPTGVWIANITWAIGFSLSSGADSSLLYDTLRALGKSDEYKKVTGRATAVMLSFFAVASLCGAWLYTINVRLPLIVGCIPMCIGVFAAYKFVEPHRDTTKLSKGSLNLMKLSILFVANNRKVKWIIAFVVLLQVVGKTWFMTYNPYFVLTHLPIAWYGWIFFSLNVLAAAFSALSDRINRMIAPKKIVDWLIVSTGVPMLFMGMIVHPVMCGMVLFQNIGRVIVSPFAEHLMHDELDSGKRATIMSVKGAAISLGNAIILFSVGAILDQGTVPLALIVMATFTLVSGGYLMRSFRRIFVHSQ